MPPRCAADCGTLQAVSVYDFEFVTHQRHEVVQLGYVVLRIAIGRIRCKEAWK